VCDCSRRHSDEAVCSINENPTQETVLRKLGQTARRRRRLPIAAVDHGHTKRIFGSGWIDYDKLDTRENEPTASIVLLGVRVPTDIEVHFKNGAAAFIVDLDLHEFGIVKAVRQYPLKFLKGHSRLVREFSQLP
jgi:hypothetical protein